METLETQQKEICSRYGASFVESPQDSKVGIALDTIDKAPLNALRHPPESGTCGWYIWGGEELSEAPDFFEPLHVAHLSERCPEIMKYLGLGPGWRILVAREQLEVWYDEAIINVEV